jgi:hypothetical protein
LFGPPAQQLAWIRYVIVTASSLLSFRLGAIYPRTLVMPISHIALAWSVFDCSSPMRAYTLLGITLMIYPDGLHACIARRFPIYTLCFLSFTKCMIPHTLSLLLLPPCFEPFPFIHPSIHTSYMIHSLLHSFPSLPWFAAGTERRAVGGSGLYRNPFFLILLLSSRGQCYGRITRQDVVYQWGMLLV